MGNRLEEMDSGLVTTRTFCPTNALLTIVPPTGASTTNSWDGAGNLLVANTGGALTTNTWSAENRLLNTGFSNGTNESYQYSQDGLRKTKTNSIGVTVYTWDEMNILLETTGTGTLQARNTNYPIIWGGLASQWRNAASNFFGFDSQFNARILVSAAGMVTDNYNYTAWGVEGAAGSGTKNPNRYGGQVGYQRDRANWMSVGQRPLDAFSGAWPTRDPIERFLHATATINGLEGQPKTPFFATSNEKRPKSRVIFASHERFARCASIVESGFFAAKNRGGFRPRF